MILDWIDDGLMARYIKQRSLPSKMCWMQFFLMHPLWFWMEMWDIFSLRNTRILILDIKEEKTTTNVHTNILQPLRRQPQNSAQESWIRRNSFWKNTFSDRRYDFFLHNPPAELLCIVTSITLWVARAAQRTNTLALCFLLAFSRQEKHYASAKFGLITPVIGPDRQSSEA